MQAEAEAPRSAPPVVGEPRSTRGNPPFYDVLGKRYYVLASSTGYVERGIASWYGRDFHGLSTSSGERYDMHAMTAAHTTLPLPTWVEVTNLSNGKRVTVKVNDRGPFVSGRIIDLSYAAAKALDMVGPGTTHVEVRALGGLAEPLPVQTQAARPVQARVEPSAPAAGPGLAQAVLDAIVSPAAADTLTPSERFGEQMFVQVGAFSQRDNATKYMAKLQASGFTNAFVVAEPTGRQVMHRVRLGPLSGEQEFDRIRRELRALGFDAHLVVGQ